MNNPSIYRQSEEDFLEFRRLFFQTLRAAFEGDKLIFPDEPLTYLTNDQLRKLYVSSLHLSPSTDQRSGTAALLYEGSLAVLVEKNPGIRTTRTENKDYLVSLAIKDLEKMPAKRSQ